MLDRAAAGGLVAVHLAYLVWIPAGGFVAWRWPRALRWHVPAVAAGVASVTVGFACPLTTWEKTLRRAGGQRAYRGGFVDRYLTGRHFPPSSDLIVQAIVAIAVIVAWLRQAALRINATVTVMMADPRRSATRLLVPRRPCPVR
jgi:hypothetical protein